MRFVCQNQQASTAQLTRLTFAQWTLLAKLGMTVRLRVNIHHDLEANVYVAESPDLEGLVVEAHTLDEVKDEALAAAAALLELKLHTKSHAQTDFILHSPVPA